VPTSYDPRWTPGTVGHRSQVFSQCCRRSACTRTRVSRLSVPCSSDDSTRTGKPASARLWIWRPRTIRRPRSALRRRSHTATRKTTLNTCDGKTSLTVILNIILVDGAMYLSQCYAGFSATSGVISCRSNHIVVGHYFV